MLSSYPGNNSSCTPPTDGRPLMTRDGREVWLWRSPRFPSCHMG